MLRVLLYLLIAWLVARLVRGFFAGMRSLAQDNPGGEDGADDEMMSCPECGTFFPSRMGVSRRAGGARRSFCSEACAERFAERGGPPEE